MSLSSRKGGPDWVRLFLVLVAGCAAIVVVFRAWSDPYVPGARGTGLMNAESIAGVALVLAALMAPKQLPEQTSRLYSLPLLVAALLTFLAIAWWPSLFVPFVADDYAHILQAHHGGADHLRKVFTSPGVDRFFRPVVFVSYWIDVQWAGFSPIRWHAGNLVLHAITTVLVFLLANRLGLSRTASWAAAALFGVHGTRPETVTWIAARFDILATMFTLAAILCFLHARWAGVIAATLLAVLCKESAYVLPLLLATLLFVEQRFRSRPAVTTVVVAAVSTAVVFVYRWTLIGGIGGYLDPQGRPTVFLTSALLILKALGLRLWAALLVPVNWTEQLSGPGIALLAVMAGATLWLVLTARRLPIVRIAAAMTVISSLPVFHLLLIGPDLEKSRVVYLASVWFALLLGALWTAAPRPVAVAAAASILAFNLVAMRHNLRIWHSVGNIHIAACDAVSAGAAASPEGIVALSMPNVIDGVYALKTGLPECVEIRHGIPAARVHLERLGSTLPVYEWDAADRKVRRR